MKVLITVVLCFSAISAAARDLGNMAVRRAAVTDLLGIASQARIIPMLVLPAHYRDQPQVQRHSDAFMVGMNGVLREHTDLIHAYIELLHNRDIDLDSLATELYEEMARAASLYVDEQKATRLGRATWTWGTAKLDHEARKHILRQALNRSAQEQHKLHARERDDLRMTDVFDLLQGHMNKDERPPIDDLRVFYTEFPQLNIPLLASEAAVVRKMLAEKKPRFSHIMEKLELEMLKSLGENDGIEFQQNVHLSDIFKRSKLIDMIKKYYKIEGTTYVNDLSLVAHLVTRDIANPRHSVALHSLNMQEEWQVTWAQLRDSQIRVGVLGELSQTMGLDWPAFGQLIYPQDARAAAQLITNTVGDSVDTEAITTALQAYRATLQADDELVDRIGDLVADLPHLVEKDALISDIARLLDNNLLTEDNQPHVGLSGESPRAILRRAIDHAIDTTGRWKYLGVGQIMKHAEWYTPASLVASHLARAGLTETQLREHVFTASGFDKLQSSKAFNAKEIGAVRQLVSAEKIAALLSFYAGEDKQNLARQAQFLPLTLQLEGFVSTLAHRLNSDAAVLPALQDLASNKSAGSDGMFAPLALTLKDLPQPKIRQNNKSQRKKKSSKPSQLQQLRRTLLKVAKAMEYERKKYFVVAGEEPQPNKTTAPPPPDQQRAKHRQRQAQWQAQQQAQQELEQQVSSLARKMGRARLPLGTPMWLRLRAILAYMEVDSQALGQRAAMKSVGADRLVALMAQDAALTPTTAELDSIEQALTQHTLSREKRGMIAARGKNILLENMQREIGTMSALVSVFDTWKE